MTSEIQQPLELPNAKIKKSIDEIIKKHGFVTYKIKLSPGSNKGDNYTGVVIRVEVFGTKENGETAELSLFCKVAREQEFYQSSSINTDTFEREALLYTEILPYYKQFQKENQIEDGFVSYAEYLDVSTTNFEEFIIMKDLRKEGFVMFDRFANLDLVHTQTVMRALGKFHAIGFALKDQKPEIIQKFRERMPEIFMKDPMTEAVEKFVKSFLKNAVNLLEVEGIYKEKWEYFHENFTGSILSCYKSEVAEPYAVISHGDCWNNNMLFKYQEGVPTDLRLLDWQISRYAAPVLDVVYYIFCCTNKTFRDEHYRTLLDIYYETLCSFMRKLGSDPEKMYPYSAFQEQLKKFGKTGLGMAVLVIPLIANTSEDVEEFSEYCKDDANIKHNDETKNLCKTRLTEVIIDMVDLGYL